MKQAPRKKQTQQSHPGKQHMPLAEPKTHRGFIRNLFSGTVAFLGATVAVIGTTLTLLSVLQLMDVYRDTIPKVELRAYPQSSDELLPFVVRNPSRWFDMKDLRLGCQVQAELDSYGIVLGGIKKDFDSWSTAAQTLEASGARLNFPCNVTNHFRGLKLNGTSLGPKRTELIVEASYETSVLGFRIARRYSSPTYLGSMTSQGFQWIEGDLANTSARR